MKSGYAVRNMPRNQRPPTAAFRLQAIFFGLGSDGTVGANKAAAAIIGERTEFYSQVKGGNATTRFFTANTSAKRVVFKTSRSLSTK